LNTAILALEDGTVFEGRSFGARTQSCGEVVFNTAITGYQEIFTDPSYCGQIVVLTYPEIGNYGANREDSESAKPYIEGLVVREFSSIASNWRSQQLAEEFLAQSNIPVAAEIDTRRLVRHLRTRGVMRGVLATGDGNARDLVEKARGIPSMAGLDLATRVSTPAAYEWTAGVDVCSPSEQVGAAAKAIYHVVAYDFGIKRNILRRLVHSGCRVTVVPALTSAEDVMALAPDGVFLSNGPGDPEPLHTQQDNIRKLIGKKPVFGICLGQQLLGLALGGKTYKLKFGHRGANHPVRDLATGRVYITAQNHGYAVDPDGLRDGMEVSLINLNDDTVEGLRHEELGIMSIQYHSEASPGPLDNTYFFDRFLDLVSERKRN
jgi:carbamoyl-phosphate synthase small subunit